MNVPNTPGPDPKVRLRVFFEETMSAIGLKLPIPRSRHVLPGFHLSLGFTLFYLTSLVLIPLLALVIRPLELGPTGFWAAISTPRVLASLRLSFGMALAAAAIDSLAGLIIAWVLVRYRFPGKGLLRSMRPMAGSDRCWRNTASASPTPLGACWWR